MWVPGSALYLNISYRVDRMLFLLFGRVYPIVRPLFSSVFLVCQLLGGRHDIHYLADVGPGLMVLHPALGTVVGAKTVAGSRLTLVGGNLIGGRQSPATVVIGSNVTLGANAVVLGPVRIGSNCRIGAGAVVTTNAPDGSVMVGVPARCIEEDR
jgi:serine O-acetyltransferase